MHQGVYCMKRKGFTLIELLVVIAIIAILAAILFPVIMEAKRAGQTSACAANIKQIASGIILYADDNSGRTPPLVTIKVRWSDWYSWLKNVKPYIKSRNVFRCPAFQFKSTAESFATGGHPSNYSVNYGVFGIDETTGGVASNGVYSLSYFNNTLSSFRRQSKMIMVAETADNAPDSNFWMLSVQTTDSDGTIKHPLKDHWPTFHGKGIVNVGFIDGHVKTMHLFKTISTNPEENMWEDRSHHPAATWNGMAASVKSIIDGWPDWMPR